MLENDELKMEKRETGDGAAACKCSESETSGPCSHQPSARTGTISGVWTDRQGLGQLPGLGSFWSPI